LAKECLGRISSCLCCKDMDHEVLDCPRMIDKVERMNMNQENSKADLENEIMTEPQKELEKVLLQMQGTMNDH
jgi:hypothetical protein